MARKFKSTSLKTWEAGGAKSVATGAASFRSTHPYGPRVSVSFSREDKLEIMEQLLEQTTTLVFHG